MPYFDANEEAVGSEVSFKGTQFRVIGVLKEKGNLSEDNFDNMVFVPILVANQMASGRGLRYELTVAVPDPTKLEHGDGRGHWHHAKHQERPDHSTKFI